MHYICEEGFEHHVAANLATVDAAVYEAATKYFGWEMYWHEGNYIYSGFLCDLGETSAYSAVKGF